jgi:AraC-like DNA-binding protein
VQPLFLFFHPRLLSEALTRQQADLSWLERVHPMNGILLERLGWLARLGNSCSSFSALKADSIILDIIQEFIREALAACRQSGRLRVSRRSTRIELFQRLSMVKEWILADYSSPITLKDMAAKAMLNSQHFLRMFRDCYGTTPHQFLIDTRLESARQMLVQTKEPVSAICRQTGFESISSFSGLFSARFGVSPSIFRQHAPTWITQ